MSLEKVNDLYEKYRQLGSMAKLLRYINKRLRLMEMQMEPAEYVKRVVVERDAYIDGFQLKEYDAFEQGYEAAWEEFTNNEKSSYNG